jgi:hypothetical protein
MRGHYVRLFTVIGSLLSTPALAQAPSYTFTNLDVPFPNAQNGTFAEGTPDRSQVVGIYVELGGAQHGFIEDGGAYPSIARDTESKMQARR